MDDQTIRFLADQAAALRRTNNLEMRTAVDRMKKNLFNIRKTRWK